MNQNRQNDPEECLPSGQLSSVGASALWQIALRELDAALTDDPALLRRFASSAPSPGSLRALARAIRQQGRAHAADPKGVPSVADSISEWWSRVDESPFGQREWLAALEILSGFDPPGGPFTLSRASGYIQCSSEAVRADSSGRWVRLADAVAEMLDQYGIE